MSEIDRRSFVVTVASMGALMGSGADAQQPAQQSPAPAVPRFMYEDVLRRARDLATTPFTPAPPLPDVLTKLDFDAWRDIRFRKDRAMLANGGGPFRLELFHLGHLYKQPVTINIVRDGLAAPIPYAPNLFDYGRTKFDKSLPLNLGFAGFRLHYPLNDPRVFDEAVAFLGASYYRFLGRNQRYGLSARALSVNAGTDAEEFPFFREFWIETPGPGADRVSIYALLDSESVTGAFRFDLWPGADSVIEISGSLFPRRSGAKFGIAPLTSMFFEGENDQRVLTDYRPELHDSDGLLLHSGSGEWLWRPLRNPAHMEISTFLDKDIHGFGLLQRDRNFDHYQDLDLNYEMRPSYWIEPMGSWGEGRVELVELPTSDETNDNIVASWVPNDPPEAGKQINIAYRVTASLNLSRLSPNARVVNTYQTQARALGSHDVVLPNSRRFIVDFAGGDLAFFQSDPAAVEVVPTANHGRIIRSFLETNPHIRGFRAFIDVQVDPGQTADLRAFLRSGTRTLTETWTIPWHSA